MTGTALLPACATIVGGGNLVPTIIECDEETETENSEQRGHRTDVHGQH